MSPPTQAPGPQHNGGPNRQRCDPSRQDDNLPPKAAANDGDVTVLPCGGGLSFSDGCSRIRGTLNRIFGVFAPRHLNQRNPSEVDERCAMTQRSR